MSSLWFAQSKPKAGSSKLPRSKPLGIGFLAVDSLWAFWLVSNMDLGEFSLYRTWLQIAVPIAFILTLIFVDEFLAVRALGMLALAGRRAAVVRGFSPTRIRASIAGDPRICLVDLGPFLGRNALPSPRSDPLDHKEPCPLPSPHVSRVSLRSSMSPRLRCRGVLGSVSVSASVSRNAAFGEGRGFSSGLVFGRS